MNKHELERKLGFMFLFWYIYYSLIVQFIECISEHIKRATADTFSPQEAVRRASKYNTVIQFDEIAQSSYFRYVDEQGQDHEVWFEDARSAQAKFNLVKQYNLRGISYGHWAIHTLKTGHY